jgi:hypothetical protein
MALAGATIRRPVGSTLDLGTGCGVQALFASQHSDRVVASDVNPRAVALATLTMELNGAGNVDVRAGDLLDAVVARRSGWSTPTRRSSSRRPSATCSATAGTRWTTCAARWSARFIPQALTWEPGERPEWRRSARWHVDVSAS